ncbi:MAG TPA: transposase family protein, partial [Actinoplanes sp.]|nr:transposase family protein [Actinoplanes sp.]
MTLPDLTVFARLDVLGLQVTGQQVWPDKAILFCTLTTPDAGCPGCGQPGGVHDRVLRRFTHLPVGRRATWLHVEVPRYRCGGCRRLWRHPLTTVARLRSKRTRAADWWALSQVVLDHTPISGVAAVLDVSWDTAHTAHSAVAEVGTEVLIEHPGRLDGVEVIGVDEHCWRHTRKGDKFVTVVIDLTPIRDDTGPARLLDMVEGRSKQAFKTWLAARPK